MSDASAADVEPPLAGVRVLDLTRLLPGPMCTLYLADLGADVVKVEDTGAGDYARSPRASARGAATRHRLVHAINRNKRSLAVDLKSAAATRRSSRSRNARTSSSKASVRASSPRSASTTSRARRQSEGRLLRLVGYGQTGPRAALAGHDINYLGYAGTLDYTGERGGAPALGEPADRGLLGGAASAAIGILAALFGAQRTGRGRYVDVAMADAVLAHQIFLLGALEDHGTVRRAATTC